jgi:aspartate aminotransferase, mitochondrial
MLSRSLKLTRQSIFRPASFWASIPAGPPDPILGVTEAFKRDSNPKKMNLGVGAYRDDNNKPYVLESVVKAEDIVHKQGMAKEYLGITGDPEFNKLAAYLAYGKDIENLSTTQAISGTGALRVGGVFLARFFEGKGGKKIYLPTPTWGNHIPIFRDSGLEVKHYKYFDKATNGLDFEGMKSSLREIPDESVVVFHACAHNPTGVDPTKEQWKELSKICKEKKFTPFFDMVIEMKFNSLGIPRVC